ncbi:MAG TPA: BON domain-containing protein [Vicinamibacterales bacterium]|nr:BON domain-containing protein [Vicinamibacterales bacterium]
MKAVIGCVVAAAALFAAGQVPMHAATPQAPSATTRLPDSTLGPRIEKRINDSSLKKYNIKVSVNDGVVTLTGTVPTEADRRKAADLAAITGVSRVDNQLIVDLNATGTAGKVEGKVDKGAEKTKSGVDKAIDKSAEGVNTAWEKTKEGANTAWVKTKEGSAKAADKSADGVARAGEAITDTYIKTRVHTKFVDEDLLKGSDISVDVKDHVVTLSGTVPSEAGRDRAIEQTKKVDGVHKIVDKLMIGPKK